MQYQSISEIYEANEKIHAKLVGTLASLSDEQAAALPDGEKWSIAQIAEHVSIVGGGMYRICAKLLAKAEAGGRLFDGSVNLETFAGKTAGAADVKLEAPEMVHPSGTRSIAESVQALDEAQQNLLSLKPLFEKYNADENKFPHPYFGDMTAVEWLALAGGHEGRHLRQIRNIVEKLGGRSQ